MTLSTSTVTLAPGSSRTYTLAPGEAVTVATEPNCYVTVTETPDVITTADQRGQTNVRTSILQYKGEWTYGPYALGGTVVVAVSLAKSTSSVSATLGSTVAAVVGAAGAVRSPQLSISGLPTAVAFGNSIPSANRIGANSVAGSVGFDAHLWWAQACSGHAFEWVQTGATTQIGASASSLLTQGIYGYSGATSVDIYAAAFDAVVIANRPSIAIIQVMENDVTAIVSGSITRQAAKDVYLNIVSRCLAQGTVPVFVGCMPSKSYSTAAHSSEYWALTSYVEGLRATYPGMIYVPVHDLYMDSSITTPQPLSSGIYANYTDSSVHQKAASPLIGARIADVMALSGFSGFGLIPGPGDARYIGGNAFTAGTGGTASAPVSGSVVNNLTVANNTTTATIAASVVDRKNRQAQQVSITAGTSTGLQNMFSAFTAAISAGAATFAVGDTVQAFIEIEIDSATTLTGLRDFTMELAHTGGAVTPYQMFKKAGADLYDTITIPAGRKILIATPLSVVTAGTTAVRQFFYAYASNNAAALAGKFWITKFAVVNWSKSN